MIDYNFDSSPSDQLNLKRTVKQLCASKVRYPLNSERVRRWLNQFDEGSEKQIALLILRFLLYRNSSQLSSSLKQAFKNAASHFMPTSLKPSKTGWKSVLSGQAGALDFLYGPPNHAYTKPGKSGEIISRLVKSCIPIRSEQLSYPKDITQLQSRERFLLIDDATYTGQQLIDFIADSASFMRRNNNSTGIVVAIAHQKALGQIKKSYPHIPVFYGELITENECFPKMCSDWVKSGLWSTEYNISPMEQYLEIVKHKGKFSLDEPLGYGGLGCLTAYEHGVPDDTLQLLWDKSESWQPLFER